MVDVLTAFAGVEGNGDLDDVDDVDFGSGGVAVGGCCALGRIGGEVRVFGDVDGGGEPGVGADGEWGSDCWGE